MECEKIVLYDFQHLCIYFFIINFKSIFYSYRIKLLSTYIIANLGIVSVFMGATAYSKKNGQSQSTEK